MQDENSFNLGDFFRQAKSNDKTPPLRKRDPSKPYSVATPFIEVKTYQKLLFISTVPMAATDYWLSAKTSTARNPDFFSEEDVEKFMDESVRTTPRSKR